MKKIDINQTFDEDDGNWTTVIDNNFCEEVANINIFAKLEMLREKMNEIVEYLNDK